MKLTKLAGLAAAALFVAAACQPGAVITPTPGAPGATPPSDPLGVVQIPAGEPIHIAFWGVLSGADAILGEDARRGVEIAINDRDGQLLGREIRLSTQDGLCTPEGGATAATALAADATIVGLIGSSCSDETAGGIATITNAGLTTISPSNTRPAFTDPAARDDSFAGYLRTAHSDAVQGVVVAEFATDQDWTTAATIHDGSAYAEALVGVFEDSFQELGGTITVAEAVEKGQQDMTPVLTRIAADSPDVIFYPLFTAEAGFVTAQAGDIPGLENTALIGADAGFSADMVNAAGPNAVGKYLSSPDFGAFGAAYTDDFLPKYREQWGEPGQVFHAHGYDATNILLNAIEQVAVEIDGTLYVPKGALREAIYATSNHQGLTGTLNCNENGDCSAPVIAIYQLTEENVADPATNWPPPVVWRPGD